MECVNSGTEGRHLQDGRGGRRLAVQAFSAASMSWAIFSGASTGA